MPSSTHKPIWTILRPLYSMHTSPNSTFFHYTALLPAYSAWHVLPKHKSLFGSLQRRTNVPATHKKTSRSTSHDAFTQLQFVLLQALLPLMLQKTWSVHHPVHLKEILYVWMACHSQSGKLPVASSLPQTQLCIQDRMYRKAVWEEAKIQEKQQWSKTKYNHSVK